MFHCTHIELFGSRFDRKLTLVDSAGLNSQQCRKMMARSSANKQEECPARFWPRGGFLPQTISIDCSHDHLPGLVLFTRELSPLTSSFFQPFFSSLHPLTYFSHYPLQLFAHPSQLLATCLSILSAFSKPFAHIVSTLLLISVTIENTLCKLTATSSPSIKGRSQIS